MASDTVFKNVQNVYSYEWANSDSNYIWKYYYEGFRKRNVDITNKLTQHSGHKAVSIDIRQFYPSVKGRLCLDVLKKMLDRSNLAKSDQQFIFRSARRGTLAAGYSLPVGPPIGHALGNVYLSAFDQDMFARYGSMYHRYVDDMVVIVPEGEDNEVVAFVEERLKSLGLALHSGKTKIFNVKSWIAEFPEDKVNQKFSNIRSRLMEYLALDQSKKEKSIREYFVEAGFNLPFSRMRFGARSEGFLNRLKQKLNAKALRPFRPDAQAIVDSAKELRDELLKAAQENLAANVNMEYSHHSAVIKRQMNLIINLCYMYPVRDIGHLLGLVPEGSDFAALRCLITCCVSGDATHILSFPGRIASMFAQLWSEADIGLAKVDIDEGVKLHQRDALSVLLLYNVVRVPYASFRNLNLEDRELLMFCLGQKLKGRMLQDLSYVDEIRSLQSGSEQESASNYILRRLDAEDELVIEMGGGSLVY